MAAWLQVDGARLMTDRDGQVLWSNLGAQRLMERNGSIAITDGVLSSHGDTAGRPIFPDVLHRQGSEPQGHVLPQSEVRAGLLITARLVEYDGMALCGLSLRPTDGPLNCDGALLRQAFGLTTAEQTVLLSLARGESPDGVALAGGQSVETVRTHIRRIYAKMEVSSRETLFAKLAPFLSWPDERMDLWAAPAQTTEKTICQDPTENT